MHTRPISSCRAILASLFFAAIASFSTSLVLAEDFDWRSVNGQNWLSPVKDQFGGTCWDFAACGVIEAKYMLTRNDNSYQPDVSEQQINWETNPDMGSAASGGQTWKVMDYFTSHGVVLESECPTQGTDVGAAPYWPLATGWQNRVFKSTSDVTTIAQGTSLSYVKSCLKTYGPLTVHMEADIDFYDPPPGEDRGGHQVVIVGYHDNVGSEDAPGGGYWIIRNSWGAGWNGNGYGKIAYATQPSYENWSWLGIYNRDVAGLNGPVYYTGAMVTATWKSGSVQWMNGASSWSGVNQYGTSIPNYSWENKESTATFNAPNTTTIYLRGKVVAHAMIVNSGATGYVFSGIQTPSLTITGGGIIADENVTINAPVTIGAPQAWTVSGGKSLTIGGAVHTIISPLSVNGDGDTTITGSIDGGGALNLAGAAPGTITKSGAGALRLTGAATYSVPLVISAGSLSFEQAGTAAGNCTSAISGGGQVVKSNSGTIVLSGANTYSGTTSVNDGAVQADSGVGLPAGSLLNLNGGVLQGNSAATFTRALGTSGSNKFQWNTNGGGFAAGNGPMTVNIGGNGATVNWGSAVGAGIVGTLKFGSNTANNITTFQNGINLAGADRTIQVDDNSRSTADRAELSGAISNASGKAGITKTGSGLLVLSAANSYNGLTTVEQGILVLRPAAQNAIFSLGGADLRGGKTLFDYTGAASPAATIESLLCASCDAGLWDTGRFRSSTAAARELTLGWFDDGSSTVTVMPTYAGDFNLDGMVNTRDLDIWKSNVGMDATWQTGDANYDGIVNLLDLDLWKSNVGLPAIVDGAPSGSGVGVPEPGTLGLLCGGLFAALACAWRRRG